MYDISSFERSVMGYEENSSTGRFPFNLGNLFFLAVNRNTASGMEKNGRRGLPLPYAQGKEPAFMEHLFFS